MKEQGEIDGEFEGVPYRFLDEKDSDGFSRHTAEIWINGAWRCAVPCSLWTSGDRWENEMRSAIKKNLT